MELFGSGGRRRSPWRGRKSGRIRHRWSDAL